MTTGNQMESQGVKLRTRKCREQGISTPIDPKTLLEVERDKIYFSGTNKRKKIKRKFRGIGGHNTSQAEAMETQQQHKDGLPLQKTMGKHKKLNVRRKNVKPSETVLSPAVLKTKLFFQRQIEAYYPSSVSPQQLSIIDSLIHQSQTAHYDNSPSNIQSLLKLDASNVLRTLTPIAKEDGQVVSVMIRRPNISAIMYFRPNNSMHVEQNQHAPMELEPRQLLEQPSNLHLELNRVDFLNPEEGLEIQKRTVFMQCQQFQQNFKNNTQIENQIGFWRVCADIERQQNVERLERLRSSIEEQKRDQSNRMPIGMDGYITMLIRKNMKKSLENQPLETLNYFNLKANQEYDTVFRYHTHQAQMKRYVHQRLKNSSKRKFPLTTSCLGCLSNIYQLSNPFIHCGDCGTRIHRTCNIFINTDKCTICIRKNNKKFRIRECILCPNRGLAFRKTQGGNIHLFCIIFFGLYQIKNCVAYVSLNKLPSINGPLQCLICQSSRGPMVSCQCDIHHYHPLCAYLDGYPFQTQRDKVFIDCQADFNDRTIFLYNRKYRANLDKFVLRYPTFQRYLEAKKVQNPKTTPPSIEQQLEEQKVIEQNNCFKQPMSLGWLVE